MNAELFFFKIYFKTLGLIFWPWKVEIQKCSDHYLKLVTKLVKNNGKTYAISYLKNLFSYTSGFVLGSQRGTLKPSHPISIYKTGWPKCLKGFPQLITEDHIPRVIINSILRSYLIFTVEPVWNPSSIIGPYKGKALETKEMYASIGISLKSLGIKPITNLKRSFVGWHLSKKAGPNGQATQFWFRDLIALTHPYNWTLYSNLLTLGKELDKTENGGWVLPYLNLGFIRHDYVLKRWLTHVLQYYSYLFLYNTFIVCKLLSSSWDSIKGRYWSIRTIYNEFWSTWLPFLLSTSMTIYLLFQFILLFIEPLLKRILSLNKDDFRFIYGFRVMKSKTLKTGKTKVINRKVKGKVTPVIVDVTKRIRTYIQSGLNLCVSRFSLISEHGGKTRTIVIADIFSQSFLKPFHEEVFTILRSLHTDGTHDQDGQCERIKKFTQRKGTLYSFDLKDCTDRFPLSFQRQVVSSIFGWKLGGLWEAVIADRWIRHPFDSSLLRYEVGQPMGLLSSWAVMALSHHVVVSICAHKCGLRSFGDYSIVGDDIVIANDMVAKEYRDFMTNTLGVDISEPKTIISDGAAEFCKRLYYRGFDCSPVPPMLVNSIVTQPRIISMLKSHFEERYSWYAHPVHYYEVLQKKHWRLARYMLTCPLWFSSSVFLWKMYTKEDLWALVQETKSLQTEKTPSEVSQKATADLVSWNRFYGYALDLGGSLETPPGKAWARIVDPLLLGSMKNEPLKVKAGKGFITHNLHKEGSLIVCTPTDLHSNFLEVERKELNKNEVLKLSRALSSIIKKYKLDLNEVHDDIEWFFSGTMYSGRSRRK